jgi:hypothetical protein
MKEVAGFAFCLLQGGFLIGLLRATGWLSRNLYCFIIFGSIFSSENKGDVFLLKVG